MPGLFRSAALLIFAGLAFAPANAQDRISADQISTPRSPVNGAEQLNLNSQISNGATISTQQIGVDRGDPTRVLAVPAGAADACDNFLAKRGPEPSGVDCVALRVDADRRAESGGLAPTTIAESGLTASPARHDPNSLPDAQDVARRLATGDLNASAVAQAVGSGFGAPPVVNEPKGPTVSGPRAAMITVSRP